MLGKPTAIAATEITASKLGKGDYSVLMTLREALSYGELKGVADKHKYGFFSPVDEQGNVLKGEATMLEGIVYWTEYNKDGNKLKILPPNHLISFGQIMVLSPDEVKDPERKSNQTVSPKNDGQFSVEEAPFDGFDNKDSYERETKEKSAKWVKKVTEKPKSLLNYQSIAELVGDSISGIKAGSPYSKSNMGMVMACFKANIAFEGSEVRTSFEPTAPLAGENKTKYPPVMGVTQHKEPIKPGTKFDILFTNFQDRLVEEDKEAAPLPNGKKKMVNVDVPAPHLHGVPSAVVDLVKKNLQKGLDINKDADREQINREIAALIEKEKLQVGGHITKLGKGVIKGPIRFQPEHACVIFEKDVEGKGTRLTDDKKKFSESEFKKQKQLLKKPEAQFAR